MWALPPLCWMIQSIATGSCWGSPPTVMNCCSGVCGPDSLPTMTGTFLAFAATSAVLTVTGSNESVMIPPAPALTAWLMHAA